MKNTTNEGLGLTQDNHKKVAEIFSSTMSDIEIAIKKLLAEANDVNQDKAREDIMHRLLINACSSHKLIANISKSLIDEINEQVDAPVEQVRDATLTTLQTIYETATTTYVAEAAAQRGSGPKQ